MAHATFANEEINLELAEKVIANVVDQKPQELSVEKIRDVVCDYFGLSVDKVLSKSRVREVTNARQIAMYLSKQMTKSSLSEIGRGVGNRDHATVLHSFSVVNDLMDTDKEFKRNVQELEQILRG
jgi:chromosomal replication initiator protein